MIRKYALLSGNVLQRADEFWLDSDLITDSHELLRFSFAMGFFTFAGYLFYYAVTGRIWSEWPFIHSTLPVTRGLMCAGLQWVFFSIFPTLSTLILEISGVSRESTIITTHAMVPMHIAALFVGVPFVNDSAVILGLATFVYLLFYGFRRYLKLSTFRSVVLTSMLMVLFVLIRQMFVFVIGF